MTLTQLQEKRGELVTQARSALEEIKTNTDESRAAELEARHDAIMAEFDKLEKNIEREEKIAAMEARAEEARAAQRPGQPGVTTAVATVEMPSYRDAFLAVLRTGGLLSEVTPEERAVLVAGQQELRVQTAGTNGAGGFTVPTDLEASISETMKMWGPMYDEDICTVLTTTAGNPIDFPRTDDTATAIAQHTEGAAMTDDGGVDAVLTKMTLNAFAYDTEWVQISMELLQDSAVNFETFIGGLLGKRIGRRVNTELTVGDGTGDPNGIVTASSLGVTAAGAAAITSDELINLQHSVDPAYRQSPKARWMFNDSTLAVIRKLKDGQNNYLWQMGDVRTGAPAGLLGHNYSVNQAMANVATGLKSVIFGDFSQYYVRKVGSPVVGVRREYYWPNIGMAGVVRLDGDLIQTGAVKHLIQA